MRSSSQQELVRSVNIPKGFPPGFVIGRGGAEIKRMQERYAVRVRVDSNQGRVTVRGTKVGVNATVKELLESFEAFTIKQLGETLRLNASADADKYHWRFEPLPRTEKCEDVHITIWNHALKHMAATDDCSTDAYSTRVHEDKWLKSIQLNNSASIAAFLRPLQKFGQLDKHKVSLVVGKTYYELIQPDLSMRSLSASEIQSYRHKEAFRSRWSNVFDRNSCHPSLRLLVEALETRIQVESLPVIYAMKAFMRNEHRQYDGTLIYRMLDGNWQFKRGHLRTDAATADIIVNNDTELRVWVTSRSKSNGKLIEEARKYVNFDMPASVTHDECAFTSKAILRPDTPVDLVLKLTYTVAKYRVVYEGLHFTLAYTNRARTNIRLSCRSIERNGMQTCYEEACALLHRMSTLLEQPPKEHNEERNQDARLNNEPKEDWEDWD